MGIIKIESDQIQEPTPERETLLMRKEEDHYPLYGEIGAHSYFVI
jgi:hypothetical protein